MNPWIVMRCYNDAWIVGETLSAIASQRIPHRLIVFDNESTDGSQQIIKKFTNNLVNIPKGEYIPGRVLNQAMRQTDGDIVVFLNSDCIPQNKEWLEKLVDGFSDEKTAAVFGRQVPRPECWPLFAKDTEDTFGDGHRQEFWKHCFSMASSAIRRSVWEEMPFRDDIQYSEDVDWTWRARQNGYQIAYVAESIAMHSHNYTLRQFHNRQYGEGKADAGIFSWEPWEKTFLRYSLLPFARQVLSDCKYGLKNGRPGACLHSLPLRLVQMLGRRKGFVEGMKEYGHG